MIRSFRRFFRRNFCSAGKAELLELLDEDVGVRSAIIQDETSPLARTRVSYRWRQFADHCSFTIHETDLRRKSEQTILDRELPEGEFLAVLREIENAGGASLGNFYGEILDGVFYTISWGTAGRVTNLDVKNPQAGSPRHEELIRKLKVHARAARG